MAAFAEHITQAKKNLAFLIDNNSRDSVHWDWQVTVCFYTAVHVVNAHIAQVINEHYRTHERVKDALNPFKLAPARIPEDIYLSYGKLEMLSRRSRYLCSDDKQNTSTSGFFTYDKHFAKAIKNLDKLLYHFSVLYNIDFQKPAVKCADLTNKNPLSVFTLRP